MSGHYQLGHYQLGRIGSQRCALCRFRKVWFSFSLNYILRLRFHSAIYRPDSFVLVLRYCANLEAITYESTSLNRIVADKSHRVIVGQGSVYTRTVQLGSIWIGSTLARVCLNCVGFTRRMDLPDPV